jgi:ACS family pantothenate transporter-like MFS transporter
MASSLETSTEITSTTDAAVSKTPAEIYVSSADVSQQVEQKGEWWGRKALQTPEQKLLLKLDIYIMSWACFGYFIRLLDTTNMSKRVS